MYIMLQNQGEIPDHGIRLLGYSNKNNKQIGRFGSGLKESVALSLRLGMKMVIFSGVRRIEFSVHTPVAAGPPEIVYTVNGKGHFPMNLHPDFGHHDWTTHWQVLRELFCNAIDEGGEYFDLVAADAAIGIAGSTRVFIETDYEVLREYGDIPNKLLMLNKKIDVQPIMCGAGSIFCKKVFVQQAAGLFNYNRDDFQLNEARSMDWYHVYYRCGELWERCSSVELIHALLVGSVEKSWKEQLESHILETVSINCIKHKSAWRDAFTRGWPDSVPVPYDTRELTHTSIQNPVVMPVKMVRLLSACGVKTYYEIVSKHVAEGFTDTVPIVTDLPARLGVNNCTVLKYTDANVTKIMVMKQGSCSAPTVLVPENVDWMILCGVLAVKNDCPPESMGLLRVVCEKYLEGL